MDSSPPSASSTSSFALLLERAGSEFGARPAIESDGSSVTFSQLAARAREYTAALVLAGVAPGDRVGILLPRGAESAAAFFGAIGAGGVAILINELYQQRQIDHVLAHAGARHLVASPDLMGALPRPLEFPGTVLVPGLVLGGRAAAIVDRRPADPAQLVYTSGSTGQPKGVLVSHGNLWAGAMTVAGYLGIGPGDRIASILPFSFVYGFNQLTCCLVAGACLVLEREPLAQDLAAALRRDAITVLAGVPPLWHQLLGAPGFTDSPLPALRVLTCAGGRLPPEAVVKLRTAQPQADLYLMYGLSEVFRSTFLPPAEVDAHPDSMGRAIPGSQVFVCREDLSVCGPGEVGELVHRGPSVALGYWNDPETTDRVFRAGPIPSLGVPAGERVVRSGDFVRADESGLLYYVGRRDHMIKTLGFRISPDEVADVIHASGQVADVVVVGVPDNARGQAVVAVVTLREGGAVPAIKRHCASELPRYMQPTRIVVLPALPKGPTGKYDFEAIRTLAGPRAK